MKKIFCFISLLMALNCLAQLEPLDLGSVVNGRTIDVVCFLMSEPGNAEKIKLISCGNKRGPTGALNLDTQTQRVIAEYVESGNWNLTSTFVGKQNITVFVFTKK